MTPDPIKVELMAGTDIATAARQLVVRATTEQAPAAADFNGITLTAEPIPLDAAMMMAALGDRAAAIVQGYMDALLATSLAKLDDLPGRDAPGGLHAAVEWVRRVQPATNHVSVGVPADRILQALTRRGYVAGECRGDDYVAGDREIEGRYIVGQAMECLEQHGAIHQLVASFAGRWLSRWTGRAIGAAAPRET